MYQLWIGNDFICRQGLIVAAASLLVNILVDLIIFAGRRCAEEKTAIIVENKVINLLFDSLNRVLPNVLGDLFFVYACLFLLFLSELSLHIVRLLSWLHLGLRACSEEPPFPSFKRLKKDSLGHLTLLVLQHFLI